MLSARSAVGASSLAAAAALVAVSVSTNNGNRNTSPAVADDAAPGTKAGSSCKGGDDSDGGGGGSLFPGPSPWPAEGWTGDGDDSDDGGQYQSEVGNTSRPFIITPAASVSPAQLSHHQQQHRGYVEENHPNVKQEIGDGSPFSSGGDGTGKRGGQRGGRGRSTPGSRTSWRPVRKKKKREKSLPYFFFFPFFLFKRLSCSRTQPASLSPPRTIAKVCPLSRLLYLGVLCSASATRVYCGGKARPT